MRHRTLLVVTLLLALAARVGFVLAYPQVAVVDDAAAYDEAASRLASGQEVEAPFARGPVYPLFLVTIYRLAGHDHTAVRLVQAVISFLAVWLIYALGRAVFNAKVGLLASFLAAGYPPFVSYPGWLLTETLSTCLLLAFVYVLIRAWQQPRMLLWAAAGLLGGVMALHRSELLLVVACSAVAVGVWRAGVGRVGTLVLAAALVILPWAVRNALLVGAFTTASAPGSGHVLWISTVEIQGPEWDPRAPYMRDYEVLVAGLSPIEADRRLRQDAVRRILADPLRYLRLCAKRIPAFWVGGHSNTFAHLEDGLGSYLARREYGKAAVKLTMLAGNLGLIMLGFWGLYLAWALGTVDPRPVVLTAIPVIVKALTHVLLFAALRYQVPIMSFLIVFAAFAIWHVRRLARELVPVPA